MDYTAYFRELADYYNHSRIPSKVMTGEKNSAERILVSNLREEEAAWVSNVFLLGAGLSHVSGPNWQRELKDRTSRGIYLRP